MSATKQTYVVTQKIIVGVAGQPVQLQPGDKVPDGVPQGTIDMMEALGQAERKGPEAPAQEAKPAPKPAVASKAGDQPKTVKSKTKESKE